MTGPDPAPKLMSKPDPDPKLMSKPDLDPKKNHHFRSTTLYALDYKLYLTAVAKKPKTDYQDNWVQKSLYDTATFFFISWPVRVH